MPARLEERIPLLNAKFDELGKRLLTLTDIAPRAALLEGMRRIHRSSALPNERDLNH